MPDIVDRLRALSPFNNDQAGWLQERDVALAT
jgi:cysteine desulfurase